MNCKTIREKDKVIRDRKKAETLAKTYKGEWYTINSILGNDWARFFYLLGGREAGKSYSVMKWVTNRKLKRPDGVKVYWFRLTEASQKNCSQVEPKTLLTPT